jgi:hypothetical protein
MITRVGRLLAASLALFAGATTPALTQSGCATQPTPINNPNNVDEILLLRSGNRYYAITEHCHTVRRSTFGRILNFRIVNRFPEGTWVKDAYVYIKSHRKFTSMPPIKISLSRNDGWYFPDTSAAQLAAAPSMAFEPFSESHEKWNESHASPGSPSELAKRLNVKWHAFLTQQGGSPSTIPVAFWQTSEHFNQKHDVQTNYLIRFVVSQAGKLVPFEVYIQPEVKEIELEFLSNIDAISGSLKLRVVD